MLRRAAFLALFWASVQVAGHSDSGSSTSTSRNVASNLEEYCFYSIYTSLSAFTFEGSVTVMSSSSSSHSHGGDSSSSSDEITSTGTSEHSHGSSLSNESDETSSAESSAAVSTGTSEHSHGSSSSSSYEESFSEGHTHGSARRSLTLQKRRKSGGSYGSYSTGPCNSTIEVTSMYASAKAWCSEKEFKAVIPYWQSLCTKNSMELMSLASIEPLITDEYITSLPQIDPEQNNATTFGTIDSPVLLTKVHYDRAHKSYVSQRISQLAPLSVDCQLTKIF